MGEGFLWAIGALAAVFVAERLALAVIWFFFGLYLQRRHRIEYGRYHFDLPLWEWLTRRWRRLHPTSDAKGED